MDTVNTIIRNSMKISVSLYSCKRQRPAVYPELEMMCFSFVKLARSLHLPVTGPLTIAKLEQLIPKYNLSRDSLKARKVWLFNFLCRSGIQKSIRLWSESYKVDNQVVMSDVICVL